jgi:hypothetical protein
VNVTVKNHGWAPIEFIMAINRGVHAMMAEDGSLVRHPTDGPCAASTWFAMHRNVRITGTTRLRGGWRYGGPLLVTDLAPGETREVRIEPGGASEVDALRAMGWWLVFRRRRGSGPRRAGTVEQIPGREEMPA